MHTVTRRLADPFAMLLNPAAVVEAMERSERLGGLNRRVCRPLDKPLIPRRSAEMQAFDESLDDEGGAGADAE